MHARLIQQEAEDLLTLYKNQSATLSVFDVQSLATRAVTLFFDFYQTTLSPLRVAIELLCDLNASNHPEHNSIGLQALFTNLIERLNDAFFKPYCSLYDRVFAQVISYVRHLPEADRINQALHQFGLSSEASLLQRKRHLNQQKNNLVATRPMKKIIFLSRVTIGADIAVTSVAMAHLKGLFPAAELVLIGASKLQPLYAGDSHVRVREIAYGRSGNLLSRIETWLSVLAVINDEISGLHPLEYCIIDPDSRLTQLGLLPLFPKQTEQESYFFFPSRCFTHPESNKIGQLTAHWVQGITTHHGMRLSFPYIALSQDQKHWAQQVISALKDTANCPLICLSFGVGGNPLKRVSETFERDLVLALSRRAKLIIDCGISIDEQEQVNAVLLSLLKAGKSGILLNETNWLNINQTINADVLTWRGGLGTFAALLEKSDLYIGYDSAGQHIAAALGVPTITLFVNSGTHNFPLRWQPFGPGTIKTLHLDSGVTKESDEDFLINQILEVQEQLF